ncbi:MAG: tetratricopeptide repeat protein [Fidelibacterota bacterium]
MKVAIPLLAVIFSACTTSPPVVPPAGSDAQRESGPVPQINTRALQHFLDGEMLVLQGDYARAVLEFQDALLYDPSAPAILTSMANAYLRLGKFQRAESTLREALSFDPKNREALELLGHHYLVLGRLDDAKKQYRLLREFHPEVTEYRYILAEIELRKGNPESAQQQLWDLYRDNHREVRALKRAAEIARERNDLAFALKAYRALIQADSTDVQAWRTYSELAILLHRFTEAIGGLEHLVELTSKDPGILERLAVLYYENDDADRARDIMSNLHSGGYRSTQVLYYLGRIALEEEDYGQAAAYSSQMIEEYPDEISGYTNLALAYINLDRTLDAISLLLTAREKFPGNFAVNFLLGNSYTREENYVLAKKSLLSALEISPSSRSAKHLLATVYNRLEEWGQSDQLYRELLGTDAEDSQALNNYSYTLVERGVNLDQALEMAMEAIRLEPDNSAYLDTIGWVYFKVGQYAKAIEYIRKSLEIEGNNPVVLEHMGDVLFTTDQREEALDYYRKALDFDPDNKRLQDKLTE